MCGLMLVVVCCLLRDGSLVVVCGSVYGCAMGRCVCVLCVIGCVCPFGCVVCVLVVV